MRGPPLVYAQLLPILLQPPFVTMHKQLWMVTGVPANNANREKSHKGLYEMVRIGKTVQWEAEFVRIHKRTVVRFVVVRSF